MSTRSFWAIVLLGVVTGLVLACYSGSTDPTAYLPAGKKSPPTLDPANPTLKVGESVVIQATTSKYYATNFSWTSSNASVVTLGGAVGNTPASFASVTATCVASGSAGISVSSDIYGTATGTVGCVADQIAKVDTPKIKLGAAPAQLTATGASGSPVNAGITWTASNPSVLSVTTGGLATAVSPGTTTITATSTSNSSNSVSALAYVLGNGACTLNPGTSFRNTTFVVQSDPGNHATEIGVPGTALLVNYSFSTFGGGPYATITGPAPLSRLDGGFVAPTDCAFVANGTATIGSKSNVGVRLEGTWKTGAMTMKFTVGTNGELSGGATLYTATAN
jgi:hypothetical protein